jgi:hypothetical protein
MSGSSGESEAEVESEEFEENPQEAEGAKPANIRFGAAFAESVPTMKAFASDSSALKAVPALADLDLTVGKAALAHALETAGVPLAVWTGFLERRTAIQAAAEKEKRQRKTQAGADDRMARAKRQKLAPAVSRKDVIYEELLQAREAAGQVVDSIQATKLHEAAVLQAETEELSAGTRVRRQRAYFAPFIH